jgi:hypothetical protein
MADNSGVSKGKTEKKSFKPKPLDSFFFEKLVSRAIHEGKSEEWVVLQVKAAFAMKGVKVNPEKDKPKSTFVPNSIDKPCKFGKNCKHLAAGTCAFKKHE